MYSFPQHVDICIYCLFTLEFVTPKTQNGSTFYLYFLDQCSLCQRDESYVIIVHFKSTIILEGVICTNLAFLFHCANTETTFSLLECISQLRSLFRRFYVCKFIEMIHALSPQCFWMFLHIYVLTICVFYASAFIQYVKQG